MKVVLTITRFNAAPKTMEITEPAEITIGRVSQCQICLAGDGMVSRQHAAIFVYPPTVWIKDLGSTNGFTINGQAFGGPSGQKLTDPRELRSGDQINLGKSTIQVEVVKEATPSLPPVTTPAESGIPAADTYCGLPYIPGYRLHRSIGAGGMGTVYEAVDENTGATVAVKTMAHRHVFNNRMVSTFGREIEVSKTLNHPNIAKFLDSGVAPGDMLYLVLEYINGGNLAAWKKRYPERRMPVTEALPMLMGLADGMGYAHNMNFVHRDIKPQNVLIQINGQEHIAKLTDLGLAKNFEDSGLSGLTASFSGGGTMDYMPPEQLTDFRDVKPSSDVFSLMATFYEMLAGKGPYNFGDRSDVIKVVSTGDIIPITERVTGLPDALVKIIARSLNPDPDERYQSCNELLAALKTVG